MKVGKAIYNILINDSGILGTVSTRIFPEIAAQGEVQPYIVYSIRIKN
jgi:hypothetical protein